MLFSPFAQNIEYNFTSIFTINIEIKFRYRSVIKRVSECSISRATLVISLFTVFIIGVVIVLIRRVRITRDVKMLVYL